MAGTGASTSSANGRLGSSNVTTRATPPELGSRPSIRHCAPRVNQNPSRLAAESACGKYHGRSTRTPESVSTRIHSVP